jgi:hypothetical protein
MADRCSQIQQEIDSLMELLSEFRAELQHATGPDRTRLLWDIRNVNRELSLKRQELRACEAGNAPRPDLVAQTVSLIVDHPGRKIRAAAVIKNIGLGNANGPFDIHLGATLTKGGVTTTFFRVFQVPAGVVIHAPLVISPGFAAFAGPFNETIFSDQYTTERMEIPLHYRNEAGNAKYQFEFLVDAEQVIGEGNEGNNRFVADWWTTSPGSFTRDTPFVTGDAAEDVGEASQGQKGRRARS